MKWMTAFGALLLSMSAWAQNWTADDLAGYYRGSAGSVVLRADGSASMPSALMDPSAEGVRWRLSGDEAVWLTPFFYSGPREFNNTMDLTPVMFTIEQRDGKLVLSTRTLMGTYTFSK